MTVEFTHPPITQDSFILWDLFIIFVILCVIYIFRDSQKKSVNAKELYKKLKETTIQSLKIFSLNFLIGWVVMITLLFFAYKHDPVSENNSFTVFWDEFAFSFVTTTLPFFVGMTTGILKFMNEFFKFDTDYQ